MKGIPFVDRRDKRDTFSIKNGIYKGKGLDLGQSLPRVKLCRVSAWVFDDHTSE